MFGGTHLLPASRDEIGRIATALRDDWKVSWMAPVHCTGEPAFAILMQSFGDRYLYAGLGTTLELGAQVTVKTVKAGVVEPQTMLAMSTEDFASYRHALAEAAAPQPTSTATCPWYMWPCGRPSLSGSGYFVN